MLNLPNFFQHDQDRMTLQVTQNSHTSQHQLTLTPHKTKLRIRDIDTWTRAFDIYCFTYFSTHANEAKAVVKYDRLIREMAWKGYQWVNYDENFRMLRESDPALYPWDIVEPHLWAYCTTPRLITARTSTGALLAQGQGLNSGTPMPRGQAPRGRGGNFRGRGRGTFNAFNFRAGQPPRPSSEQSRKCYRFNRGDPCTGACRFEHSCLQCGGRHPSCNCRVTVSGR